MKSVGIGIDDRHSAQLHLADTDAGQGAGFARNGLAGDADQFAHCALRLRTHQHLAQSGIADRVFGAGVDDRHDLDLADCCIGHHQLAKPAAGIDGDRLAIGITAPAARKRDVVLAEIEHDVAALQHVGAEKAG